MGELAFFFYPKIIRMAAATGFNFDLSDINIGNRGMSSGDVAAMIVGLSRSQNNAKREAELNEQQERERRFLIAASTSIGLGLFLLIIYLSSLKLKNSGTN